jgi:hypothetical protein
VKRWQKALGMPETGVVEVGVVSYSQGAVRVEQHTARVGAAATGQVLLVTATVRVVTVQINAGDAAWAVKGAAVTVSLPDGTTTAGAIASVGAAATGTGTGTGGEGGTQAAVSVTVTVADQKALGDLSTGTVGIRYVVRQRTDVLTVPVAALLALAEGGYGLEIVEGSATRVVAVQTGLFAGGLVEVTGVGLNAGTTVALPR